LACTIANDRFYIYHLIEGVAGKMPGEYKNAQQTFTAGNERSNTFATTTAQAVTHSAGAQASDSFTPGTPSDAFTDNTQASYAFATNFVGIVFAESNRGDVYATQCEKAFPNPCGAEAATNHVPATIGGVFI